VKLLTGISLLEQAADQAGKEAGGKVELADFIYFQVGEDK